MVEDNVIYIYVDGLTGTKEFFYRKQYQIFFDVKAFGRNAKSLGMKAKLMNKEEYLTHLKFSEEFQDLTRLDRLQGYPKF